MKVLLSLLGAVAMTSSSTALATSNVFVSHKQEQARLIQSNPKIDWEMLKEDTNKYFDDLKTNRLFDLNLSVDKTNEIFDYAEQQSFALIEEFSDQDLTLDEIITVISEKFPGFKENYNNSTQIQNNLSTFYKSSSKLEVLSSTDYVKELDRAIRDIKTAEVVFKSVTIGAAIAAAGFWAAAWWFGISIPWAIACTTISGTTGFIDSILTEVITEYNKEGNAWTTAKFAYDFLMWVVDGLVSHLIPAEATLAATAWAFGASFALIPLIGGILGIIGKYQ